MAEKDHFTACAAVRGTGVTNEESTSQSGANPRERNRL
jgi:hypothetical protein